MKVAKKNSRFVNLAKKKWTCEDKKNDIKIDTGTHDSCGTDADLDSGLLAGKNIRFKNRLHEINESDSTDISASDYVLVDPLIFKKLLLPAKCGTCSSNCLDIVVNANNKGFAHKLELKCTYCELSGLDPVKSAEYSSLLATKNQTTNYDVNLRMSMAFFHIGKGYSGVEQFAMIMKMKPFAKSAFTAYSTILHDSIIMTTHENLDKRHLEIKQAYSDLEQNGKAQRTYTDIAVSFDGSWLTRGHTSKFGVGCVIDLLTGYVVDYEVMSKYCHPCMTAKAELGVDSPEFDVWYQGHKDACDLNHSGSSGAMEMASAAIMWKRSQQHGLRYTTMLSDGDAKTHQHLSQIQVYGSSVQIEKEECVNHVEKRLGTGLRNAVKEWRSRGVTLGGKGHGTLKNTTIVKLTSYYKKAVLRNKGKIETMKSEIFASIYHAVSTDGRPQHQYCPPGPNSWCFYQSAKAKGQTPEPHAQCVRTPLTEQHFQKVLPIYQRLTKDDLLQRCAQCRTQNANESLHSMIWRKCPKTTFASKKRVELAVAEAICEFNNGKLKALQEIQHGIGLPTSSTSMDIAMRCDKIRTRQIIRRTEENSKNIRRAKKLVEYRHQENLVDSEGPTYSAGFF